METVAFFEKKVNLTPKDLNKIKSVSIEDIILEKAKKLIENKCSEHGFVLPGSVTLISRSMGYYEAARFTGDTIYYGKFQGNVIYPADGVQVVAEVIRKNKMGLYVNYKDAIRIQVPRDLHLGNDEYEEVEIGDMIEIEIKRSKFQIDDEYILASGVFLSNKSDKTTTATAATANTIEMPIRTTDDQEEPVLNTVEEEEFEEEEEQAEDEEGRNNQLMGGDYDNNEGDNDSDSDDNSYSDSDDNSEDEENGDVEDNEN
jgi:hypothetical protein